MGNSGEICEVGILQGEEGGAGTVVLVLEHNAHDLRCMFQTQR
jgi:hypothetical protein